MYLALVLLIVAYFLTYKNKKVFAVSVLLIILLNEIYYHIGNKRIENFQGQLSNIIENNNFNVSSQRLPELQSRISLVPVVRPSIVPNFNLVPSNKGNFSLTGNDTTLMSFNNTFNTNLTHFNLIDQRLRLADPISNELSHLNSVATPFNEYIFIAGSVGLNYDSNNNYSGLTLNDHIFIYNTKWKVLDDNIRLSKPRSFMSAGSDNKRAYFAFGINDDNKISRRIDYYDSTENINPLNPKSWKSIVCPFSPDFKNQIFGENDKLVIVGRTKIITYDFTKDKWDKIELKNMINNSSSLISGKLYIFDSNRKQSHYLHRDLTLEVIDKPYKVEVNRNENTVSYIDLTQESAANPQPIDNLFHDIDRQTDLNDFNYFYVEKSVENNRTSPQFYNNLVVDKDYTFSFWIYIDESNRGQTKLVMADYSLCTGESGSGEYNGLMLHKDALAPCFRMDTRILIKNNDDNIQVKYNKWMHVVFTVSQNPVFDNINESSVSASTTLSPENCLFSNDINDFEIGQTTSAPVDNSTDESRVPSHVVTTYSDGHKVVNTMDFTFTFDGEKGGVVLRGFDIIDTRREFVGKSKMAAFKIFSNHLTHGDVLDIYEYEYPNYNKKEKTETLVVDYMKKDINSNNIELLDFYENILTTSVSDKIIISGTHSESNNKKILEYDTLTLHLREKRQNIPGQIFSMIPHNNGVVCSYLTNNPLSVNLIKINVESRSQQDASLVCFPGTGLHNGRCARCPVDTYSNTSDLTPCKPCAPMTSTLGNTGQTFCVHDSDSLLERKVYKKITNENENYLKKREKKNGDLRERINKNIDKIKVIGNNLNML